MPTPAAKKPVHEAIMDVMLEIDHIAKAQRNNQQHFDFRGIDDIKNVVDPLLRKHRLHLNQHEIKDTDRTYYTTKTGTDMTNFTTTIIWCWTGPDGSEKFSESIGESSDAGDKAVAKAQSVAKRVTLIDVLNIPVAPTRDPDADAYERTGEASHGTPTPPPPHRGPQGPKEPTGRDWDAEAIAIANAGLALVTSDLAGAKKAKDELLALFRACHEAGELTPDLNRKITGHGKALGEAIASAEAAPPNNARIARTDTRTTREKNASAAAAKVLAAREARRTQG